MNYQGVAWLLYYRRHSLSGLELQERSNWRTMSPDMLRSFSDTKLCVYCKPLYTSTSGVQLHAWQQNSCTLWLCTTHQKTTLYCKQCSIQWQKRWLATLDVAVSFQLIVSTNIKLLEVLPYVLLNEFVASSVKKWTLNCGWKTFFKN